jgi:DhnA family fructose-bisphosphate aldolase class Ia
METFTPYQKDVVKRYYENKGTVATQKLGEIVSELYLEPDAKKLARLWESAGTALLNAGGNKVRVNKIVDEESKSARRAGDGALLEGDQ